MDDVPRRTTYSLFFDIYVLGQRVRELLVVAMAGSPLRPEEYAIYSVVFEDEAVSPTPMAAQLSMPLTTVVDAIRTMEQRGHVRRIPNPRDGRSYLIVLTGDGLRAHAEANERFEIGYQAFVAELRDGESVTRLEIAKLLSAAERVKQALEPAETTVAEVTLVESRES
jgi:DNA-binding MarR family transcriptional regulator